MPIEKYCVLCNKKFTSNPSAKRKFCSPICHLNNLQNNINKGSKRTANATRTCSICKNQFPLRYSNDVKKYCSLKCNGVATGNRCRKTDYPKSQCLKCGNIFEVKRKESTGKYCSRRCSDDTNKNPPAQWFEKACIVCGDVYKFQSKSTINRRKTCSRRCQGVYSAKNQPKISSIEILLKEQFDKINLKYEQQFVIGYFVADFAFPEQMLVVECDGDYWHNLPKQQAQDKRKNDRYERNGWRVLRFWENEIKQNPENCLKTVLSALQ